MILVRGKSSGKFHVVANRDDCAAVCGRTSPTAGAFSHSLAAGNEDYARHHGRICQHCLNRVAYVPEAR